MHNKHYVLKLPQNSIVLKIAGFNLEKCLKNKQKKGIIETKIAHEKMQAKI